MISLFITMLVSISALAYACWKAYTTASKHQWGRTYLALVAVFGICFVTSAVLSWGVVTQHLSTDIRNDHVVVTAVDQWDDRKEVADLAVVQDYDLPTVEADGERDQEKVLGHEYSRFTHVKNIQRLDSARSDRLVYIGEKDGRPVMLVIHQCIDDEPKDSVMYCRKAKVVAMTKKDLKALKPFIIKEGE